jgi:hypothetical protein
MPVENSASTDNPRRPVARSLAQQGQWKDLLNYAGEWRTQEPLCYLADYYAGIAYHGLNLYQLALRHYFNAVEKFAGDPHVWMNIAVTYQDIDDIAQAIPYMRRAVEARPGYAHTIRALGHGLARTGQLSEAADCFGRVLLLDGQDDKSLKLYLQCMREAKRMPELLDALPALRAKFPAQKEMIEAAKAGNPAWWGDWVLKNFRIECKCQNLGDDPSRGPYVHCFEGNYIAPKINRVWCVDCGRVTASSMPLKFNKPDSLMEGIRQTDARMKKTPQFLSDSTRNPQYQYLDQTIYGLRHALICAPLYCEMDRLNNGQLRCLRCGNTNATIFIPPAVPESSMTPTGHQCPHCHEQIVWRGDWMFVVREASDCHAHILPDLPPVWTYTLLDASGRIRGPVSLPRSTRIVYPAGYLE